LVAYGRWIVFAAICGLLALLGGYVFYASPDNPELEKAEIELVNIKVFHVNNIENRAILSVQFLVTNPSDLAFYIPLIDYSLKANGVNLGSTVSSGGVFLNPNATKKLGSAFSLVYSDRISDQYNAILSGRPMNYEAEGMITIKSGSNMVEKDFYSILENYSKVLLI